MAFNTSANINQVRAFSGAPETLISDTTIKILLDSITEQVREKYKVNFTPVKAIEVSEGNGGVGYNVMKRFPLKILELTIFNTVIDIDKVHLDWASGEINMQSDISTNAVNFNVFPVQPNTVKIKYLNAWMDKTDIVSESTSDSIAGNGIVIPIDEIDGLNVDDWVWIEGLDRRSEVAKITAVGTTDITVDKLSQTHEEGSILTKLKKSKLLSDYVLYETAIAVAINAIGSTYQLATGYSQEGVQAQIGVAWTHWRNNLDSNIKQRDILKRQIDLKLMVKKKKMSIMDNILVNFKQTNTIVKEGGDLLMSGELDLDLTTPAVSIACYVGKKKREFSQEVEGNINSFQAYVMAKPNVSPTIESHDLIITERGEKFIVGAVSQRNNGTTINNVLDDATYLYADLELFTEE